MSSMKTNIMLDPVLSVADTGTNSGAPHSLPASLVLVQRKSRNRQASRGEQSVRGVCPNS
jgi:hypothetical protein